MSRRVAFNLGPLTIQPKPRHAPKRPKAQPPAPAPYGGWPNHATWAVAKMIDPAQVRVLVTLARSEARDVYAATTEQRQTNAAVPILADMLHGWCEERAGVDGMEPMAALLATAGRGVVVSVNGHVYQADGTLTFIREGDRNWYGNPNVSRPWDGQAFPDVSAAMRERVKAAMLDAATAYLAEHPDALTDAQRTKSDGDARERRALAVQLRAQADALDVEADALEAGGRVVYREHNYGGGTRDNVRHVMRADGELLPSLREVTVSHAHRYGPRLPSDDS